MNPVVTLTQLTRSSAGKVEEMVRFLPELNTTLNVLVIQYAHITGVSAAAFR